MFLQFVQPLQKFIESIFVTLWLTFFHLYLNLLNQFIEKLQVSFWIVLIAVAFERLFTLVHFSNAHGTH